MAKKELKGGLKVHSIPLTPTMYALTYYPLACCNLTALDFSHFLCVFVKFKYYCVVAK